MLPVTILHRLSGIHEMCARENTAGLRPGQSRVDHMFSIRQLSERRNTFRRLTISIFLDFETGFDSVDRALHSCFAVCLHEQSKPSLCVQYKR